MYSGNTDCNPVMNRPEVFVPDLQMKHTGNKKKWQMTNIISMAMFAWHNLHWHVNAACMTAVAALPQTGTHTQWQTNTQIQKDASECTQTDILDFSQQDGVLQQHAFLVETEAAQATSQA